MQSDTFTREAQEWVRDATSLDNQVNANRIAKAQVYAILALAATIKETTHQVEVKLESTS